MRPLASPGRLPKWTQLARQVAPCYHEGAMRRERPTYDLGHIQALVARGAPWRVTTLEAHANAALLGFDDGDIVDTVLELRPRDFYKSMESERHPGLWQDVYRASRRGIRLYVKLQLGFDGCAVVIQFKRR